MAIKKLSSANLQIEKTKNRDSSTRQSAKDKTRTTNSKDKSVRNRNTLTSTSCRRHKGHVADNNLSDTDTESSASYLSDLDKDKVEEVAAHSQDLGKVPPSLWVSDTGATAYMTNQRQLFRSLTPVKRCTIRVGEGKLYLWHIGICELRVLSRKTILLKDVLFVPNLSVNLLSS